MIFIYKYNAIIFQNLIIIVKLDTIAESAKTFGRNDWVNILLPDSSGAKWFIKDIRPKYEKIYVGKNNQQLIIPINIFKNHNLELKLPIIRNETESHPFKYVYKFDNQIIKTVDTHPSQSYYTSKFIQNEYLFSKLRFNFENNVGVFGNTNNLIFHLPQLNIAQSKYSTIQRGDRIIIELPDDDKVINKFNQNFLDSISYTPPDQFEADPVIKDDDLNIEIIKTDQHSNLLSINKISTRIRIIKPSQDSYKKNIKITYVSQSNSDKKYHFPIKEPIFPIFIGSPILKTQKDTLSWPIDKLKTPLIEIDDSKSIIIGLNDQVVKVRLSSDQDEFEPEWDYNNFTKHQQKDFTVLTHAPSELIVNSKIARNGQKDILIPSLPIKGPTKFENISDINGNTISIEVSYDSGQNYPRETKEDIILIVRPVKIAFVGNCYTHEKYRTHFLPTLIIEENKEFSTINAGDKLLIILNKNEPYYWSRINKLKNSTVKSSTADNGKTLVLEFLKKLDKSEPTKIPGIQLNTEGEITEKFSPKIVFEKNPSVVVDTNFTIFPTNLSIQLESSKLFNLRNSKYYQGNGDNNEVPNIIFQEKGKYSMLHKGDTLLIAFPDQIKIKDFPYKTDWASQITFNNKGYDDEKYYLKCIIGTLRNKEVSLSGLTIEYPKIVVDSSNINYRIINNYNTYKTINNYKERVHEIRNKIAVSAGQPTIFFKNKRDRRYIIGDQPRKLPTMRLDEDMFETHLVAGDSILFELKDALGFYWDINKDNLVSNPQGIFENKIIFKDSLYAQLNIKRALGKGKKVDLDGFFVRVNPNNRNSIYEPTSDNTNINIYGGKNIVDHSRPQKFGHDFTKDKPIEGRLGIGRLDISWPSTNYKISSFESNTGKSPPLSTIEIKAINLDEEEIPDTLYLKISTDNKNDIINNFNEIIWKNVTDQQPYDNIKILKINDEWLKFKPKIPLGYTPNLFLEKLKITTRNSTFKNTNGNTISIGLYANNFTNEFDRTVEKEIKIEDEASDCGEDYLNIFKKNKILSVILEDNTDKYKLEFNIDEFDDIKLVNDDNIIFAEGKGIEDELVRLIDFELDKDLEPGEAYTIKGIKVQFSGDIDIGATDTAEVKFIVNTPDGRRTYLPSDRKIICKQDLIGTNELINVKGDPDNMKCVLQEESLTLRKNSIKENVELSFTTNAKDLGNIPPDFRIHAEKLNDEYDIYVDISDKDGNYIFDLDISRKDLDKELSNSKLSIAKEKSQIGLSIDIDILEYQWCLALLEFLKDPYSVDNTARQHYNKFKELKNKNKTYRKDLYVQIEKLEKEPIEIIKAIWDKFKKDLKTASEAEKDDDSWYKLFNKQMNVTFKNKNLFYELEHHEYPRYKTIKWDYDIAKYELAIRLNDFQYAEELAEKLDINFDKEKYHIPNTQEKNRMRNKYIELNKDLKNTKLKFVGADGISQKWSKSAETKTKNADITTYSNNKNKLVFNNPDQYSAYLYSNNHPFPKLPGDDHNYVPLYSATGEFEDKYQLIYGGGEYLLWPKTAEATDQTFITNMIYAGVLFSLALLQLAF